MKDNTKEFRERIKNVFLSHGIVLPRDVAWMIFVDMLKSVLFYSAVDGDVNIHGVGKFSLKKYKWSKKHHSVAKPFAPKIRFEQSRTFSYQIESVVFGSSGPVDTNSSNELIVQGRKKESTSDVEVEFDSTDPLGDFGFDFDLDS